MSLFRHECAGPREPEAIHLGEQLGRELDQRVGQDRVDVAERADRRLPWAVGALLVGPHPDLVGRIDRFAAEAADAPDAPDATDATDAP